jgi:hypothetical protein
MIARTKAFYDVDNRKSFTQLTRAVKKFLSSPKRMTGFAAQPPYPRATGSSFT